MTHPTEDELAQYAFDPDAADAREIEMHVAACPRCSASLSFIRSVDAGIGDSDAWDIAEDAASPTREAILDLAARLAGEDDAAEHLLKKLLVNPARAALANLAVRRKFLTSGVARRLLRAATEACDREPLEALTFADAAIEVADGLIGYPPGVIHELRAHAWKERANALAALGRYDASLDALDHAEREFRNAPSAPLGHAIVQHARAIVHYYRGKFEAATELLAESATIYASLGDTDRYMRARHCLANAMFGQGDIRGARAIYEELLAWGEAENDLGWMARGSNTLGRCAYEMGDFSAAVQQFHRSMQLFRELDMAAEALRPEWGFALVVLASGKPDEALVRFGNLRENFRRRGMLSDEALVSLDMMDALHAVGRHREIAALASEIIESFTQAGMLTSALAAFAYLKEAAPRSTAAPRIIQYVRQFISRLQQEPALLFCPPDENF
jgi:tetratricopeptide (TPR) repeat protein